MRTIESFEKELQAARDGNHFYNPNEAREERARLLDEARAILNRPGCTSLDGVKSGQLTDQAGQLRNFILRAEQFNNSLRIEAPDDAGPYIGIDGGLHEHPTSGSGKTVQLRDRDGREVRAVRRGTPFRQAVGCGRPSMGLGKMIRSIALGQHGEETRGYYSASDTLGGYTLNAEMSAEVIDLARSNLVLDKVGCLVIPMDSHEMKIAAIDSAPSADWYGENDLIEESQGSFGQRVLKARALATYCRISLDLVEDSANSESLIEDAIAKSIAQKLDWSFLNGPGSAIAPVGLLNSDMVTAYPVDAGLSYDVLLKACRALWQNNIEVEAFVMSPEMRTELAMLKDGMGNYHEPPSEIASIKRFTSSQLENDGEGLTAYVGTFQNVLWGVRNEVKLEISPFAGDSFQRRQIAVRCVMRTDILPARANDILKLSGIVASG